MAGGEKMKEINRKRCPSSNGGQDHAGLGKTIIGTNFSAHLVHIPAWPH